MTIQNRNLDQEIANLRNLSPAEITQVRQAMKDMKAETDPKKKKELAKAYQEIVKRPILPHEADNTKKLVELALLKLYYDSNDKYFAYLFFQVERKHDSQFPTMGVGVRNGKLIMAYNSRFVDSLSVDELLTVIKHESYHLINQHLTRGEGAKTNDKLKHTMENISMDCAINQYLNQTHCEDNGWVTLKSFRKLLTTFPSTFALLEKQPYEYYYNLLNQERENRQKEQGEGEADEGMESELSGQGTDDHDMFGEMDALDQAMLEDKLKKAYDQAKADGVGKIPQEIQELMEMLKKPTINWKRMLKQFAGMSAKSEVKRTRAKRNRRYGIKVAGKKHDYTAKILVGLDTSGSMDGARTEKVLSEIYGIWKNSPELAIDIAECDTEIKNVFSYTGKDKFPISGRGGTALEPLLAYAQEHGYDGCVVLTDGEFYGEDFTKYKVPSLWVIAKNRDYTSPIGRTVYVD